VATFGAPPPPSGQQARAAIGVKIAERNIAAVSRTARFLSIDMMKISL
jgi:hypothetical protein